LKRAFSSEDVNKESRTSLGFHAVLRATTDWRG
jgi:hypothetical protein